ncbi:FUSC family protein [Asanoa sp. WMMD1127]|uniref:FUSC family protein n=1 Tax=Asanoa sp. WMMD1127 TaxID=3016107 RepID=UPI002416FE21|nr:FUSC family protein [Asanoa sp. WMMD1127]MDG4825856.1 FUSC family protein [Asanoa sp. WMMD1127]
MTRVVARDQATAWPATATRATNRFAKRLWHDGAVRRAARAAVVMPSVFAIGLLGIGDVQIGTFSAIGVFCLLLLVEFVGPMRERIEAELALIVAGGTLIAIGTLISPHVWLAAPLILLVAFVILFSGVVSSVLASASLSLLLAVILAVSLPAGPAQVIPRLAGWGLAAGASLLAVRFLWPAPARDPLRPPTVAACRALAEALREKARSERYNGRRDDRTHQTPAEASGEKAHRPHGNEGRDDRTHQTPAEALREKARSERDNGGRDERTQQAPTEALPEEARSEHGDETPDDRTTQAAAAVTALHQQFLAAPTRPAGLTSSDRTRVRLIDELAWIRDIMRHPAAHDTPSEAVATVKDAAADLLDAAATLLEHPDTDPDLVHAAQRRLDSARARMGQAAMATRESPPAEFISALEPSFRVQEVAYAIQLVARNITLSVAAERRTWLQRALGQQPGGLAGPFATARERALAHLQWHSTWLHNSLRGAVGVAAAVAVVHYIGVQHSFWVIFGALAVLRSNALSTGQNAVRAIAGTVVGFVIGAVILIGIGTDIDVLWALLPIAVLMAGIAPALISFAAGQAAFTVTLLILFNIIQPAGWELGLIRIEDIAIGVGISILVGLLLWPRGARQELRRALADAYDESARYLHAAVAYAALCCDGTARPPAPTAQAQRAAAAARRLDDTFRTYLTERGAKPMPLAEITSLVNGVAGLRIAADAVLDLWQRGQPAEGDRAAARSLLLSTSRTVERWYTDLAGSITGDRRTPAPSPPDLATDGRLLEAVRRDLSGGDRGATSTAVRVIWTADHLDAARRLEEGLAEAAGRA